MKKHCINLLPWREEKYKIQCYLLYKKLIFILIAQILIWGVLFSLAQQNAQQSERQQTQLQKIKDELFSTTKAIRLLQTGGAMQKRQYAVANPYSLHIVDMLTRLPLEQGELNYFGFEPLSAQQIKLSLQGRTSSQHEFEQLHRFLKMQSFIKDVQLSQFDPQPNGELFFNLNLMAQTDGKL